jgi:rubredoxin
MRKMKKYVCLVCDYIYVPEEGDPVGGSSKDPNQQQKF